MEKADGDIGATSALYVWNGMSAFWGTSFSTRPHRHETLQLVFDIDKVFKVKDQQSGWESYSSAIIRDSHLHQFDSNDSIQLFIYLDAKSDYARKLSMKYLKAQPINNLEDSNVGRISSSFFKQLLVNTNCDELFKGFHTIIEHLIDFEAPIEKDKRIVEAINFISQISRPVQVKEVANHVCLSESRLRYLFKREVGQSIQSFMVWMKVINSLGLVLKGESLVKSAYRVGFWDASHMNKSYKEILGAGPNDLQKFKDKLRVIMCDENNFYTFKTEILKDWHTQKPIKSIIT